MTRTHRSIGAVLLVLLLVTAGCSGGGQTGAASQAGESDLAFAGGGDGGAGGGDGGRAMEATPTPAATRVAEDASNVESVDFQPRARIRTGRVELEVAEFDATRRNLTNAAERHGGFVSDASQRLHRVGNETYTTGVVVLRVPKSNFTDLMDRIEREGTVLRTERNSRDVTDQLVDIEARLSNLRAQRERLRELYDRANDTESILQVQERLSEVQTEIERLEARQQSLTRRVALSTITVEIREPRPDPDRIGPDEWYEIGVVAAFLQSVNGVVVVARAIVVGVAYALPYLLAFGLPLGVLGYAALRRRRNGPSDGDDPGNGGDDDGADGATEDT